MAGREEVKLLVHDIDRFARPLLPCCETKKTLARTQSTYLLEKAAAFRLIMIKYESKLFDEAFKVMTRAKIVTEGVPVCMDKARQASLWLT